MTILNLFGLYTAAHIDWCVGIEHQLVKQRDIRKLECSGHREYCENPSCLCRKTVIEDDYDEQD
jgi:hypothetical protein